MIKSKKPLFSTSEYLDALTLQEGRGDYDCKGKDFTIFPSAEAAEKDAELFVAIWKSEGIKKRKPTVYRVILEKV